MESMRATHVVFVDDEPKVCHTVQKTLERAGMRVRCYPCADDCVKHLASQKCDLLITDVRMPGRDGMDLLDEVRERWPWIPVLIVTGYGDVPMAVRALKAGAADFVEKPLDRDTFLETVERLIEQSARPAARLAASLTKTERRVLYLILDGRNSREMAEALHRSPRTIEVHRSHILEKLGVTNIAELLRLVADLGLLPSGPARGGDAAGPEQANTPSESEMP